MMPGYDDASNTPMKKRRAYMPWMDGVAAIKPIRQPAQAGGGSRRRVTHQS